MVCCAWLFFGKIDDFDDFLSNHSKFHIRYDYGENPKEQSIY